MPQLWKQVIRGEPGESYVNETERILWQWHCNFANSCGRCIEMANSIGRRWPLPIHRGCSCTNVAIPIGATASPFLDYREEVAKLDKNQQRRVIGAANLRMVEKGVVKWEDIVDRTRIRTLQEVVDEHNLTVKQMVKAGVPRYDAQSAFDAVHTPAHKLADAQRQALVDQLRGKGLTADQIKTEFGQRIASKVGIVGPSGKQRPPGSTPAPITPPSKLPPKPRVLPRAIAARSNAEAFAKAIDLLYANPIKFAMDNPSLYEILVELLMRK